MEVESGTVTGRMSKRALRLVLEWYALHREELRENWSRAWRKEPLFPIPPLEQEEAGMFIHVNDVRYEGEYKLRLVFDDGAVRVVDLENELNGPVFEPLRDIEIFRQVAVNNDAGTIEWPNGADFAPEFLYETGVPVGRASGRPLCVAEGKVRYSKHQTRCRRRPHWPKE